MKRGTSEFVNFILGEEWTRGRLPDEFCMHMDTDGTYCDRLLEFHSGADEGACEEHAESMGAVVRKAASAPVPKCTRCGDTEMEPGPHGDGESCRACTVSPGARRGDRARETETSARHPGRCSCGEPIDLELDTPQTVTYRHNRIIGCAACGQSGRRS